MAVKRKSSPKKDAQLHEQLDVLLNEGSELLQRNARIHIRYLYDVWSRNPEQRRPPSRRRAKTK